MSVEQPSCDPSTAIWQPPSRSPLYTIVVGLGFARVFGGWDFADDVIAIVVVGHGASFALRRLARLRMGRGAGRRARS